MGKVIYMLQTLSLIAINDLERANAITAKVNRVEKDGKVPYVVIEN